MTDWLEARRKLKLGSGTLVLEFGKGPAGFLPPDQPRGEVRAPFVLVWVHSVDELDGIAEHGLAAYERGGVLWFCYPKKSSKLARDLHRDHGWDVLTNQGVHPVTQVALNEDYTALRFRYRDEIKQFTRKF